MKRYIKANEDSDDYKYGFTYRILKPLIADGADEYFDFLIDSGEEPEYDSAIEFIVDHVEEWLNKFGYTDIERATMQYLDNNYNFKQ